MTRAAACSVMAIVGVACGVDAGGASSANTADAPDAAAEAPPHTTLGDASPASPDPVSAPDASPNDATPTNRADADAAAALRFVAYLPNYSGSYADWAKTLDLTKMTHLNLAFATATAQNGWDMGASDADVTALVGAAHAKGVKVLASLGGGGGDQTVIARYRDPANVAPLVASLDAYVAAHDLDGVDVDIEDPNALGADYTRFVGAVVAKLRPEGKLVTAAVAQYLQDAMGDATLRSFDFVNVMIYSTYDDSVSAMSYYASTKHLPPGKLTLGAGFFGTDDQGDEYAYKDVLAADPTAWSKDAADVQGKTVHYTGMASMKRLADYAKGYGGIMVWELSEDASGARSLTKVIEGEL